MNPQVKIPDNILETLKCTECSCYLAYGPIRLKIQGGPVCGRCLLPDNSFVSDTPYENLARIMYFPCRYKIYGCERQEKFGEVKTHEDNCEFKEYRCPVVTDGSCQWLGSVKQVLEHVENNHNDKVLKHPCLVPQFFTQNQANVYITSKDDFLFLIHVETSVGSRKMHHWVKILSSNDYAKHFEFKLKIESSSTEIIKRKRVLPFDSSDFEENALVTSISGLQDIFDKLDDLKVSLSIQKVLDILKCSVCQGIIKKFVYQSNGTFKCEKCLPPLKSCSICVFYKDIDTKLNKHKQYFCKTFNKCQNCEPSNVFSVPKTQKLLDHIKNVHVSCYHSTNVFKTTIPNYLPIQPMFSVAPITEVKKIHAIKTDIGTVLCEIYKSRTSNSSNDVLYLNIYANLANEALNNYNCHLDLLGTYTNFKFEGFLNRENGLDADWSVKLENFEFFKSKLPSLIEIFPNILSFVRNWHFRDKMHT